MKTAIYLVVIISLSIESSLAGYENTKSDLIDTLRSGGSIATFYEEEVDKYTTIDLFGGYYLRIHDSIDVRRSEYEIFFQRSFSFDEFSQFPGIVEYILYGSLSLGDMAQRNFDVYLESDEFQNVSCGYSKGVNFGYFVGESVNMYFAKGNGFFLVMATAKIEDFEYMTSFDLSDC